MKVNLIQGTHELKSFDNYYKIQIDPSKVSHFIYGSQVFIDQKLSAIIASYTQYSDSGVSFTIPDPVKYKPKSGLQSIVFNPIDFDGIFYSKSGNIIFNTGESDYYIMRDEYLDVIPSSIARVFLPILSHNDNLQWVSDDDIPQICELVRNTFNSNYFRESRFSSLLNYLDEVNPTPVLDLSLFSDESRRSEFEKKVRDLGFNPRDLKLDDYYTFGLDPNDISSPQYFEETGMICYDPIKGYYYIYTKDGKYLNLYNDFHPINPSKLALDSIPDHIFNDIWGKADLNKLPRSVFTEILVNFYERR